MIKCSLAGIGWCSKGGICRNCEYYKQEKERQERERKKQQGNIRTNGRRM